MNLLTAAIGTTLAYASDLPRALLAEARDAALDRGLELLASRRPWRVVARPDYIMRYYLAGRMGHAFPDGTPTLLPNIDGTAYLHRIGSPDAGRAHHSHPWEWAISIVLTGGYVEEVVEPDGTVMIRSRPPGSVGVLTSSTYHRIAELAAPRAWTLFIVGPRTPSRDWYFRRLDGSIVHEAEYHANLEAERAAEQAWIAAREAERAGVLGRIAVVNDDGSASVAQPGPSLFERRQDELNPRGWWGESFGDEAIGQPIWGPFHRTSGAPPLTLLFPEPGIEKRIAFEDGSVAELLIDDQRALMIERNWRVTEGENMATQWVRRDLAQLERLAQRSRAGLPEPTTDLDGYTFEPGSTYPSVIIRRGDAYIGSVMSDGSSVRNGALVPPDEVEKHAAAWAHARRLRSSMQQPERVCGVSLTAGPHGIPKVGPATEGP
jgi:hypothetical protein